MIKFIIYWTLVTVTPCPPKTLTNEFGVRTKTVQQACDTRERKNNQKVFYNADSAFIFYERLKWSSRNETLSTSYLSSNGNIWVGSSTMFQDYTDSIRIEAVIIK